MTAVLTTQTAVLDAVVGDSAGKWDRERRLPVDVLRRLGTAGVLCAQVPAEHGGPGLTSLANGELTARAGTLCGSVRSIMTAQGMAAWTVTRHGAEPGRSSLLSRLVGGDLVGVAMSEPQAGSDLAAITAQVRADGDEIVVSGTKVWVTGAAYADVLLVFGRDDTGGGSGAGAVAVVPTSAPGVTVSPAPDPLGCRAAGHARVELDEVRLPVGALVCSGAPLSWLVTSALAYGRLSVAWGCVGMLRACRQAAVRHARTRKQFGTPLAQHQLVARHLADLWAGEQSATRVCEHASRSWDDGSVEQVTATVLAKYVAADLAAGGASSAVQVLGSAGVPDDHVVARAYRDAKLMQLIEGSTEICQMLLADHATAVTPEESG